VDLARPVRLASEAMQADSEAAFAKSVCLPFLLKAQNKDGGWGFHPGSESRAEPACWALMALTNAAEAETSESIDRGIEFLRAAQLADGSWPSTPEERRGCWVTSLACWVLASEKNSATAVASGLGWLCGDWPRDSTLWRRLLGRFSAQRQVFPINAAYRGWGWTPRTSSWVEPTAFALLALQAAAPAELPAAAERRRQLAEALLYDRMCPGGGWNCGNPRVYGVAGEPLVVPTAWALLALRAYRERQENASSLAWLAASVPSIKSAGSLALARICLETYGRPWPSSARDLQLLYSGNAFLDSVQVAAWASLTTSGRRNWLRAATGAAA
jgi:Squalene-hopene cyclase C-terminal domain/Prenyltransferase and squalene oxidase repeat